MAEENVDVESILHSNQGETRLVPVPGGTLVTFENENYSCEKYSPRTSLYPLSVVALRISFVWNFDRVRKYFFVHRTKHR